ncbi:MAG: hypothetical protein GXO77_15290 [Calditrichaeota bacterium]|nr:hypothetical protein [Calditrichota bacterium]
MSDQNDYFNQLFFDSSFCEVGVQVELCDSYSAEHYVNLFKQLRRLGIKQILLSSSIATIEKIFKQETDLIQVIRDFNISVIFKPDLVSFMVQNLAKIDRYLIRRLFCNRDYFKRHKILTKPVFHFYGSSPEIFTLKPDSSLKSLHLKHPEDVDSVFLISNEGFTNIDQAVTEITHLFNPATGELPVQPKPDAEQKIVVLRRSYFDKEIDFSHLFNYYDSTAFAALQKSFKTQILRLPVIFQGVVYHLDKMFNVIQRYNGVSYSSNLEKVLGGIKKTIAFYFAAGQDEPIHNIFLSVVFKRYFNSILKPRFNVISPDVHYILNADSPLSQLLDINDQFILEIDADKFHPQTPYYWKAISTLKRASSQMFSDNKTEASVISHKLTDSGFSLSEQKFHIDLLAHAGATRFWWKIDDDFNIDRQNFAIIAAKLDYAHQLGAFLSKGLPVSQILVLNPSFDRDQTQFLRILKTLHQSGINYELLNFDLFNSAHGCKLGKGTINFNQKSFRLVLLPSVQIIPYLTMKKLYQFYKTGGQIAAIRKIPTRVELREKQQKFEAIRDNLWMIDSEMSSITFLQNESGGKCFFIPEINLLQEFLAPYGQQEAVYVEPSSVLFQLRETQNAFLIFVTNPDAHSSCSVLIKSSIRAHPFIWDFKKQIQKPVYFWRIFDNKMEIPRELSPLESQLIILQKNAPPDSWHLAFCSAAHCEVDSPAKGEFLIRIRQQTLGPVDVVLEKKEHQINLPLFIDEPLTPIMITADHWIMKTAGFKKVIHLHDLERVFLVESSEIQLQKTFVLRQIKPDHSYYLELGMVHHYCRVFINGEKVGSSWYPPYRFDVSARLKAGENTLEIHLSVNKIRKNRLLTPTTDFSFKTPIRIIPYKKFFVTTEEL